MCQQKKTKFDSFLGQWNVLEREHKIIFGHFLKYKQQKLHNELLYIADQLVMFYYVPQSVYGYFSTTGKKPPPHKTEQQMLNTQVPFAYFEQKITLH